MMKNIGIYLLLLLLGLTLLIGADLMSGIPLRNAVDIITHSFSVLTPIEYVLIPFAALIPIFPAVKSIFKRMGMTKKK